MLNENLASKQELILNRNKLKRKTDALHGFLKKMSLFYKKYLDGKNKEAREQGKEVGADKDSPQKKTMDSCNDLYNAVIKQNEIILVDRRQKLTNLKNQIIRDEEDSEDDEPKLEAKEEQILNNWRTELDKIDDFFEEVLLEVEEIGDRVDNIG